MTLEATVRSQVVTPHGSLRRIKVPTATETACSAIQEAIILGNLKPGERLVEKKLAASLGVGQPTIRESLRELEHQGLVFKMARGGTYVAKYRDEDYRQMLEVRVTLEGSAVAEAARHLTPEAEHELGALIEASADAAERDDVAAFHQTNVAFHRRIWMLSGNRYLANALETVAFRLMVFSVVDKGRGSRDDLRYWVQDHRTILGGIATRDGEKAREVFVTQTVKMWEQDLGTTVGSEQAGTIGPG